jgi:hypothetical protein
MASHLDRVATATDRLIRRSRETGVKILGLDGDLVALAVALDSLSLGYLATLREVARIRLRLDDAAPAPAEHAEACECRQCCLLRMVALEPRGPDAGESFRIDAQRDL